MGRLGGSVEKTWHESLNSCTSCEEELTALLATFISMMYTQQTALGDAAFLLG